MMLTDHITTGVPSPLIGPNLEELGTRFPDMSEVYSKRMREIIKNCAVECGIDIKEGVYVQFTGPNYETPAEVRMARLWGGDAVGMSTVPEVIVARHMGIEVFGVSVITDLGLPGKMANVSHEEVQEIGRKVTPSVIHIVSELVRLWED
jgi:purine-nucleoside phosphorylase